MNKKKIAAILLAVTLIGQQSGTLALANNLKLEKNVLESKKVINSKEVESENESEVEKDFDELYVEIQELIDSEEYSDENLVKLLEANNEITLIEEYTRNLDQTRRNVFGSHFKSVFKTHEGKEEADAVLRRALTNSKTITESSKLVGHGGSEKKVVEILQSKGNEIVDITDEVLAIEGNQVLDKDSKIEVLSTHHEALSVNDGRILLDKSKLISTFNTFVDIFLENGRHATKTNLNVKVIVQSSQEEVTLVEKLYNEIKELIDSEEYSDENLVKLLEANNEITLIEEYTKNLDQTRRNVFGSHFKGVFKTHEGKEEPDAVLKKALTNSKTITESSKLVGHGGSEKKVVEILQSKGNEIVDITDEVLAVEGNQVLDKDSRIEVLSTHHEALSVNDGRILLDKSKLISTFNTFVDIFLENGRHATKTNLNVKVIVQSSQEEVTLVEKLYNEIKELIDSEEYSDENLVKLLEANNEITLIEEYTKSLDQTRRNVFGSHFKGVFKTYDGKEEPDTVLKVALNNSKTITESSKLTGHFQSENKVVEILIGKEQNTIDITKKLLELEGEQKLEPSTTIEIKAVHHDALDIKEGKVYLDTSKVLSTFRTSVDILLRYGDNSTLTNINLRVVMPPTTNEDIKSELDKITDGAENKPITVIPSESEAKQEVNLNKDIVNLIIDKGVNLEIASENANLVIDSNALSELNDKVSGGESLVLTVEDVKNDVISNIESNGVTAIGSIKIGSSTDIKNLTSAITVRVKVGNSNTAKSNVNGNKVYVYSVNGNRFTLIKETSKDNSGYVEFSTSYLGDIIITDKKIVDKPSIPSTPSKPTIPNLDKAPEIIASDVIIKEGEEFNVLENVKAEDKEDGDITNLIKVIENTVDTSKEGIYKVIYEVTDSYGNKVTKEIKVTVQLKAMPINTSPTIEARDIEITVGDKFDVLAGVTAKDKEDGELTSKIEVIKNDVNPSLIGSYKVIYKVVDSNGAAIIKEITVRVKAQKGWNKDLDGNWSYYDESGKLTTGWQLISGTWYYMNNFGIMQKGWNKISDNWYYMNESGAMETGWINLGDKWYYLNDNGTMVTGWKLISNQWYYMNESGAMETGWIKLANEWYYLNDNGTMVTEWNFISGQWYYMNESGVMETGWIKVENKWYFLNDNGTMATGWIKENGNWYYLYNNGEMAHNTTIDDWYLNSNGVGIQKK